jgi:hypothetical protein
MEIQLMPLTDQEIRNEFQARKDRDLQLGLDFLTLREALVSKGILTEHDLLIASQKVVQQAKEDITRVALATQTKPPGSVQ